MGSETFAEIFRLWFTEQSDENKYALAPQNTRLFKDARTALDCQPDCEAKTKNMEFLDSAITEMAPYLITSPPPPIQL